MSELWAFLNGEAELIDDELCTILREIIVQCESDDLSKCKLLVLLREHYDPSIWLHICVILGQICNKFRLARDKLA